MRNFVLHIAIFYLLLIPIRLAKSHSNSFVMVFFLQQAGHALF